MAAAHANSGWHLENTETSEYGEGYWDEDAAEALRQPDDEDEATYGLNDSDSPASSPLLDELRRGMGGRRV